MAAPTALRSSSDEKIDDKLASDGRYENVAQPLESGAKLTSWEGVAFTEKDRSRASWKIDLILVSTRA